MDISTDILQQQVSEERDPDLNGEEDIIMDDTREEHCRGVDYYGNYKKKIHALRWEVYVQEKEDLIKR